MVIAKPVLITAPAVEPVSLADARLHLRIDDDLTAEDAWIERAIKSARRQAEHEIGAKIITQTWEMLFDAFPADGISIELHPELTPQQAITQITYIDTNGDTQTVSAATYSLQKEVSPGYVFPAADTAWPSTVADMPAAVKVRIRCGYGDAATDVPEDIRNWILMHVETAYKMRGSLQAGVSVSELPIRYHDRLLDPYRVIGI